MKANTHSKVGGFTLIELLVSMFILVILVLLSSRLFNTATEAWNTGIRKAEVNLIGRSVMDYLEREIARAVFSTNSSRLFYPQVITDGLRYQILSDTTNYNGNPMDGLVETVEIKLVGNRYLMRGTNDVIKNIDRLSFVLDPGDPTSPTYVDITLGFRAADDRARGANTNLFINTFTKRVYFPNYSRSRNDDY